MPPLDAPSRSTLGAFVAGLDARAGATIAAPGELPEGLFLAQLNRVPFTRNELFWVFSDDQRIYSGTRAKVYSDEGGATLMFTFTFSAEDFIDTNPLISRACNLEAEFFDVPDGTTIITWIEAPVVAGDMSTARRIDVERLVESVWTVEASVIGPPCSSGTDGAFWEDVDWPSFSA